MSQAPQTILITGAAKRIGRAIALDLGAQGFGIAIHYHEGKAEALSLKAELEALGAKAQIFCADLQSLREVEGLVPACIKEMGGLYGLINNASVFLDDEVAHLSEDIWAQQFAVNLRAPLFLAKSFAHNLEADKKGSIINMIDQRVMNLQPSFMSYTLTKSALWTATQTLAQALAPQVRVNAIAPGPVLQSVHQSPKAFAKECSDQTLLGYGAALEDITRTIRFMIENDVITGAMIPVDSGQHLARGK